MAVMTSCENTPWLLKIILQLDPNPRISRRNVSLVTGKKCPSFSHIKWNYFCACEVSPPYLFSFVLTCVYISSNTWVWYQKYLKIGWCNMTHHFCLFCRDRWFINFSAQQRSGTSVSTVSREKDFRPLMSRIDLVSKNLLANYFFNCRKRDLKKTAIRKV